MVSSRIFLDYSNTDAFLHNRIISSSETMLTAENRAWRRYAFCSPINSIFMMSANASSNVRLWKTFTDCFKCLPVATLIDDKIMCMHGGLSPELKNMDQIRSVMWPIEIPDRGLLCDHGGLGSHGQACMKNDYANRKGNHKDNS